MISVRNLAKQCVPFVTAAIVAAGAIVGARSAVNTELREEAATSAYSTYLEALILRVGEETKMNYKDKDKAKRSLAAAKFLLYADDAVIKRVALLYLGGGNKPGVFACNEKAIEGMENFYETLLAMREDVGRSGNFKLVEYRAVLCNLWPK